MKNETTSTRSLTDLTRLDALTDEDIDFSELPEVTPEMFAKAVMRRGLEPRKKVQLTIRVDDDVLKWFKQQGRGYQSRMNALLRAYMEAHQARSSPPQQLREESLADFLGDYIGVLHSGEHVPGGAKMSENSGDQFAKLMIKMREEGRL